MQSAVDDPALEITTGEDPKRESGHRLSDAQGLGPISGPNAKAAKGVATPRDLTQLTLFGDAPNGNLHPSLSGSPGVRLEDHGSG